MPTARIFTCLAALGLLAVGAQAACFHLPTGDSQAKAAKRSLLQAGLPAARELLQAGAMGMNCADLGQTCGKVNGNQFTCVGANSDIQCSTDDSPSPSPTATGTCVQKPAFSKVLGSSCSSGPSPPAPGTGECDWAATGNFGNMLSCNNGTCGWPMDSLDAGAYCTNNAQCASGKCANNACIGVPSGSKCGSSDACAPGLYCNYMAPSGAVCTPLPTEGQKCDYTGCAPGAGCNMVTQKCVAYYSLPDGTNATDALLCAGGGLNRGAGTMHMWGLCTTPQEGEMGQQCTNPKDGMMCVCPLGSPPSTTVGYLMDSAAIGLGTLAARQAYIKCGISSGCPLTSGWEYGNANVGSCLYYACNSASVAAQCSGSELMLSSGIMPKLNYPECFIQAAHEYFGSSDACAKYFGNCVTFPNSRTCK